MINIFRRLLLFVLISSTITSIWAYTTDVYEDPGNLTFFLSTDYMNNGFTYPDGTGLMQLYSQDFNDLYIRLLHPNGMLTKLTFYDKGLYRQYAYPLNDGYVLIIQIKDDNKHVYGKLVDWSGQVLQRDVIFADVPVTFNSASIAKANTNPNEGFLVATMYNDMVLWKIFSAPNNTHQIAQLYEGSLTGNDGKILQGYQIFPTIEGGYGIALLKSVSTFTQDPLISKVFHSSPQWILYVTFWQPDTLQFNTPRLVWQNPNPNLTSNSTIIIKGCEVDVDGTGYFCIVEVPNDATGYGSDYVRVAFLSDGSVTDISVILDDTPQTQKGVFGIRQLPYGGFMSVEWNMTAATKSYTLSVRGKDGTNVQTFELPDIGIADYAVFPNNTVWIGIRGSSNISIVLIPLPKLLPEDAGFKNLLVNSSIPPSGSSVSSDITNITLIFREQITLSKQNISIYQTTDGNPILRQSFSAKSDFCTSNASTVTCPIFKSTFNKPGATYDVVVDNDFVMSKSLDQPLSGVTEGNWVYYGASTEGEYTETTTGLLRLTPEGTSLFKQLSTADKKSFLDSMVEKLAELVPIDSSRITTNGRNQPDPNSPTRQTLFPVTLQPSDDQSQRTVQQTIDDINDLITNKDYNSFSREYPTNYLDETYGFLPSANLWENYKFALFALLAGLLVLVIVFFILRWKNPEGENFIVIKLVLILADSGLDIAFVLTSAKYVPRIYTASIIFLIIPTTFNFGLALSILMREIRKNAKFQEWFSQNIRTVSVFTLLAVTDVEVITVLGSKIAGLKMFSAPFSKIALSYVFWGGALNLFIKDIPQLVIQVM